MKERPILFSGPMVRAILADQKRQTRRLVRPAGSQREWLHVDRSPSAAIALLGNEMGAQFEHPAGGPLAWIRCPHGSPGDRLWVRETWGVGTRPDPFEGWVDGIEYRADDFGLDEHDILPLRRVVPPDDVDLDSLSGRWRPSIHMPRWASRLTLAVTSVRVERLQDISDADILAEGLAACADGRWGVPDGGALESLADTPREAWSIGWDRINGERAPWESNPWVWVVGFEVAAAAREGGR